MKIFRAAFELCNVWKCFFLNSLLCCFSISWFISVLDFSLSPDTKIRRGNLKHWRPSDSAPEEAAGRAGVVLSKKGLQMPIMQMVPRSEIRQKWLTVTKLFCGILRQCWRTAGVSRFFCMVCFLLRADYLWSCMRCWTLAVFAFHRFYGFCFPFAVDGRRCSTPVRDGEVLFRLLCLGALFQGMRREPLLDNSFSEVQGAVIFHLFCN